MTVGSWLASCAACSQAGTTIDRYDPAATTHPLWAQRFSEFQTTGAFVSGTGTTATVQKTINRFVPGEPWRVVARNLQYNGDYAQIDMEFIAGASIVLAVSLRSPASFKNVVHVADKLGVIVAGQKPSYGTYPNVDGVLIASNDGVRYTPIDGSTQNTTAFFHAKNLSAVTAVRFTVVAHTTYTAALSLAAYGYVQLMGRLQGTVNDASGNPAARLVRGLREDTGAVVGSATSDAATGFYSVPTEYGGASTLIAYPAAGENLPALALRGVVPI